MTWRYREKMRMLSTTAYEKFIAKGAETVTPHDAEAFFRLDDYVTGGARERKLDRIIIAFQDDPDVNKVIETLAKMVRKNDRRKSR